MRSTLFAIALASLVWSCQPTTQEGDAGFMHPGEHLDEVNYFVIGSAPSGADDDPGGVTLCHHALVNGTTAIVSVSDVAGVHLQEDRDFCERDYGDWSRMLEVRILGNVAGEALPSELNVVFVHYGSMELPQKDDRGIVTIKEDNGEWFWVAWTPLANTSASQLEAQNVEDDSPQTFGELVAEMNKRRQDYSFYCPDQPPEVALKWPDLVRDPAYLNKECRPGYVEPDVGDPYPPRDMGTP